MSENKPWSYPRPEDGSAFPEDLVNVVWNSMTHEPLFSNRPHSSEVLEELINPAYMASLQAEEGRPVRFRLLFDPKLIQITTTFDEPLKYTASHLVKLAPTIDIGFRRIVVAPEPEKPDNLEIIGICDPELSPVPLDPNVVWTSGLSAYQQNTTGIQLSVFGPGWVQVKTGISSFELLNCCIRSAFPVSQIRYVSKWSMEVARSLDFSDLSQLPVDSLIENVRGWELIRLQDANALIHETWRSILKKVCNARHGGTFLVVPKVVDVSQLVKFKYTVHSDLLRVAIQTRANFEPSFSNPRYRPSMKGKDLDDAYLSARDLARVSDLVASFAAVDGAVVLQRDLTLLGFGAEIKTVELPNEDELVEYGEHPHGRPEPKPLNNFGMRHRSAYRFCEEANEGAIAFVVSQDGDLRVFTKVSGKVKLWEGPTVEDREPSHVRSDDTGEQERHERQE